MVVCLGRATRLSGYLTGQAKRYHARIWLGVETDTLDADGTIIAESDDLPSTTEAVEAVLQEFRGRIQQIPPMFSARKVDGQRLHKLARSGKIVERAISDVQIHELKLLNYKPPFLDLDVKCSKGTYIRSLAADIGHRLGCGGSIENLRRTESGPIAEYQCIALDDVTMEAIPTWLIDPNEALSDLTECTLDGEQIRRFAHGNSLDLDVLVDTPCRVVDSDRAFWGIGRADEVGRLQPVCVLKDAGALREANPA